MGGLLSDGGRFKGRPRLGWCQHRSTLSTITAGLERTVCERCGHIQVRYVAAAVKLHPDLEDVGAPLEDAAHLRPACSTCGARADYLIPMGLACATHAWAEATRQDEMGFELWIPIRIDHNARNCG